MIGKPELVAMSATELVEHILEGYTPGRWYNKETKNFSGTEARREDEQEFDRLLGDLIIVAQSRNWEITVGCIEGENEYGGFLLLCLPDDQDYLDLLSAVQRIMVSFARLIHEPMQFSGPHSDNGLWVLFDFTEPWLLGHYAEYNRQKWIPDRDLMQLWQRQNNDY